ncbi:hypothetical protein [Clostridium sp. K25]|uniref:hypothetical protein n=1 Tax=Clostridium sp. K25 TaxID=1443109 RepID=UPI00057D926A|nr:hypothetical protein [Clostridium sp. K25]
MELYGILKNLINHNYYEKEDMIKKLNVFYAFNQITLEQYTELMHLVNPEVDKKIETEHVEHTA